MEIEYKPWVERIARIFRKISAPIIGNVTFRWTPPGWCVWVLRSLIGLVAAGWSWIERVRARSPRLYWSTAATILVTIIGTVEVIRWWVTRPEPYKVIVTPSTIAATPLREGAEIDTLRLGFSSPAAPIGKAGKVVSSGIVIEPPFLGEWTWSNDQMLVFKPHQDWPVNQEFRVVFLPGSIADHVLLDSSEIRFRSPEFTAQISENRFYQDPTDSKKKHVVATVQFSHPIDKSDFEKRVTLRYRPNYFESFDDPRTQQFPFQVTYDQFGGEAYIRSDVVAIPEDESLMEVRLSRGIRSVRGGNPSIDDKSVVVFVPSESKYFQVSGFETGFVRNSKHEPERTLELSFSDAIRPEILHPAVEAFLLPKDKPAAAGADAAIDYSWSSPEEVGPEVLKLSEKIALRWTPIEEDHSSTHIAVYDAPEDRSVYVRVKKGVSSFGEYTLSKEYTGVTRTAPFPRELAFLHEGSLLSLTGSKKLSLMARDLAAVDVTVRRLLPKTVNHLVIQTGGDMRRAEFSWPSIGEDLITERFEKRLTLPMIGAGKTQYSAIEFAEFLSSSTSAPRGLFLIEARGRSKKDLDREAQVAAAVQTPQVPKSMDDHQEDSDEETDESSESESEPETEVSDRRLILVTDLGVIVKEELSGSRRIFVQSISSGRPVSGSKVSIIGANGLSVVEGITDDDGQVLLAALPELTRERTPTAYVVEKESDLSFLPLKREDREINYSRFDVGGLFTPKEPSTLDAFLFTDRGIYRPGDVIHIGMMVRSQGWGKLPDGLPLELTMTDPRGIEIRRQSISFGPEGFSEFSTTTSEQTLTGAYEFALSITRNDGSRSHLGSVTARVEEFLPDRMTIASTLTGPDSSGWRSPDELGTHVTLRNLYGTPAVGRRVRAQMRLQPTSIWFDAFPDHVFFDPSSATKTYEESIGEQTTDENGVVNFKLDLDKFEKASYRLTVLSEGFEAEGGRAVSSVASGVVSPQEFLVGYKSDGDLNYLGKSTERKIHFVAIGSDGKPRAVQDLTTELLEERYVSVLVKQQNGLLAYQSVRKEVVKEKSQFVIPVDGTTVSLNTSDPGSFSQVVRDTDGTILSRVSFAVSGEGNVTRSLEKNAELNVRVNRADVTPGDEIEVSITAPYTGSGLITVERDRVYSWHWFTATTTGSVQKVRIPEGVEGNCYLNVTFVRSIDSREIFASPLSYGIVPLTVSKAKRTHGLKVSAPAMIKPGDRMKIDYQAESPGKMVIIAVDEGILQVARYTSPDPLDHFLRKRALQVTTRQIMDLLIPEYEIARELSAAGGDDDAQFARNLNPFKRKSDPPVAWWSGILSVDTTPREAYVQLPDYFNGTVRVFAVSLSEQQIGRFESKVVVQGDFIVNPNVPTFVAPGDDFVVSAAIANNLRGSGTDAEVTVSLDLPPGLAARDTLSQTIVIPEGRDAPVTFPLKARDHLGAAKIGFRVRANQTELTRSVELSVRPAMARMASLTAGVLEPGWISASAKARIAITRQLHPAGSRQEVSASTVPLSIVEGLKGYLVAFPHGCTEQITSQTVPTVVTRALAQKGLTLGGDDAPFRRTLEILQARQNSEGAIGFWAANSSVSDIVNAYVAHVMIDARDQGFSVPDSFMKKLFGYLEIVADAERTDINEFRAQAYAIYVLTRNGKVTTSSVKALVDRLDKYFEGEWQSDSIGIHLAATYRLLKLDREAQKLISAKPTGKTFSDSFYDEQVRAAQYLYIVSRHFPEQLKEFSAAKLTSIFEPLRSSGYNTYSSAHLIMAINAYVATAPNPIAMDLTAVEVQDGHKTAAIELSPGVVSRGVFSDAARSIHFSAAREFPLFFNVFQDGFDKQMPVEPIKNSIEIIREFVNEDGIATSSVKLGDKVSVSLSVRSIDNATYNNIALIDLLPGGFEVVDPEALRSGETGTTFSPDFADVREDRVLIYGSVGPTTQRFVYTARAATRGEFVVPPAFADSMYNLTVRARSLAGRFSVK